MLTDIQVEDLAKKMNIPLAGCYFKDLLPPKLEFNKVYIINLQDSETEDGEQNEGTHWTLAYIRKTPKGQIQPIYFDPYGCQPPEIVKKIIDKQCICKCPYNDKDIQSLMNNACGFYCLALAHYICSSRYRTNDLYTDVGAFLDMFDDLNKSIDWKKNEYILKMFFQSEEKNNKPIEVFPDHSFYDKILDEDSKGGINMMKLPVNINNLNKK
jgi:hypothetical protein